MGQSTHFSILLPLISCRMLPVNPFGRFLRSARMDAVEIADQLDRAAVHLKEAHASLVAYQMDHAPMLEGVSWQGFLDSLAQTTLFLVKSAAHIRNQDSLKTPLPPREK
jgi:hypothetical protein